MTSDRPAPSLSLAILALVCAVVVAPVGVVLGVIELIRSASGTHARRFLALAAIIVGSVLTIMGALGIALWMGTTFTSEYTITTVD